MDQRKARSLFRNTFFADTLLSLPHQEKRDLITGLKTRTNAGRPDWNSVFRDIQAQRKGKVTVFFCGPPALSRTLREKCGEFGFSYRKEIF